MAGMGRGAVDLSQMAQQAVELNRPYSAEQEATLRAQAEMHMGLRCNGCGERIGMGFRFTRIDISSQTEDGKPKVEVAKTVACSRDECDYADRARLDANLVEMIEHVWLDEPEAEEVTAEPVPEPAPGAPTGEPSP
jgi:hypothetical protein